MGKPSAAAGPRRPCCARTGNTPSQLSVISAVAAAHRRPSAVIVIRPRRVVACRKRIVFALLRDHNHRR